MSVDSYKCYGERLPYLSFVKISLVFIKGQLYSYIPLTTKEASIYKRINMKVDKTLLESVFDCCET